MAEPASALPEGSPSVATSKTELRPGPKIAEPLPELPEITSYGGGEELLVRVRSGWEDSYEAVSGAIARTWDRSRAKFRYVREERPLQLVVGVAVAAFVTGVALRIWRTTHD